MLIRVYQMVFSFNRAPRCRFLPSCSEYAVTALQRWGPLKGSALALYRILRCHPFSKGGIDNVPGKRIKQNGSTKTE
ncbi:MAG TPA: membrane protein insertion efficiency factor YidD [Spirochaetota bacterium]|nr:membrane protein insertion efficiency factor YidD [Spirochaetota bacterium]